MITNNGLNNDEFNDIKQKLTKDAEFILSAVNSTTGHLGDIISGLKTTISSIDIKSNKLIEIFNKQKGK